MTCRASFPNTGPPLCPYALVMGVEVEGATPQQRRLVEEIVAGLGRTMIERVGIEPFATGSDGGPVSAEEIESARGVAFRLLEPSEPSPQTEWEAWLVGLAFRDQSSE